MQIAALGFIASWFLSWLGVSMEVAVAFLVKAGQYSCATVALILLGVLTQAWGYKNCMDQQGAGSGRGSVAV
jgi:hypothetical protein